VAGPYATALYELARRDGTVDVVEGEMREVCARLRSAPDLVRLLGSPRLSTREKRKVVDNTIAHGVSARVADFLRLLVDRKRIAIIGQIAEHYIALSEEARGVARGTVHTATPLAPADRDAIVQKLQARTGTTVILTEQVDPSLLGGVVVRLQDTLFDHSVRHRLEEVRHALLSTRVHS
jgi:F-type H+-transporting ATPase subunit delta